MDDIRYVQRLLRALKAKQASSEEHMVTGVYRTLEGYREEVGYRRGLEAARATVLELLSEDERRELSHRGTA